MLRLIVSNRLSKRVAKITNEEVRAVVENANEENLSIRSLMAKQESNVIITGPREYQLELFEKAKKQNIIAVLDTGQYIVWQSNQPPTNLDVGSGKTLIAVLLLKYMIDKELEDRAEGKKRRISFFLVILPVTRWLFQVLTYLRLIASLLFSNNSLYSSAIWIKRLNAFAGKWAATSG